MNQLEAWITLKCQFSHRQAMKMKMKKSQTVELLNFKIQNLQINLPKKKEPKKRT